MFGVRTRFLAAGALAIVLLTILAPARAQETNIITFDAPGADTTPGNFFGTFPTGIDVWGTITGYYQDSNGTYHGFVRAANGKFGTFDAPGADTTPGDFNGTLPAGINDLGMITGSSYDVNGISHGFVRSPDGKFAIFDVSGVGGFGSIPLALNLEGSVVGYYVDASINIHAFLRKPNGTFTTWEGPDACENGQPNGCFGSGASNINVFGIAVGGYEDNSGNFVHHNYVRERDGTLNIFDVPGAGNGSYQGSGCPGCALGFNYWGAIAGTYIDSNSVQHSYVRSPDGKFTTFDAPGAGTDSNQGTGCPSDCPTSLNDFGAVMGTYIDSNYVLHGYLRSPNGNIVTIDPAGSLFTWSSSMNDFAAITGYYLDPNSVFHGFLAVPRDHRHNEEAAMNASSVSSATTTNPVNLPFNRVLNLKRRLVPWYHSLGVQPSK